MITSAYTKQELQARIDKVKAQIETYEDAITALSTGAQTYMLDTGQSRQSVTRANLASLNKTLNDMEVKLQRLNAQMCGGVFVARPGF